MKKRHWKSSKVAGGGHLRRAVWSFLVTACGLIGPNLSFAALVQHTNFEDFQSAASGLTNLTQAIPEIGNTNTTTYALNDVRLTAADDIWLEDRSDYLPGAEIAITGPENLGVDILTTTPVNAFGFFFAEPGNPWSGAGNNPDCTIACVESTFEVQFFYNTSEISPDDDVVVMFSPVNNQALFFGWTSDELFNRIQITETVGGAENEFFGQMYAHVVPLPAAVWLFGTALVGLGWLGRRARRR